MGAILFIILSVLLYAGKILFHARNLTFDKWCEIFISFFVFTNCAGFGLPLIDLDLPAWNGLYGFKFRLEVFMIILPVFFIVMARRSQWQFLPLPWYVLLFVVLFCASNLLNPYNLAVHTSAIALAQVVSYLIFVYLICSCVKLDSLMKGLFEGFVYTVILQTFLVICYPILGITQVVTIFRETTSIRAETRPGAPGTFTHPNSLAGYMAYTITLFTACYLLGYEKRKSLIFGGLSFFVLIFTFSRTGLLATLASVIIMILIFTTQNSSIFSLKNILTRIIPLLFLAAALILFTPIKDSFIGSNMDDMMLARLMHYYCGYEIITDHPLLGVGMNAHLEYLRANVNLRIFGDVSKIIWNAEDFMINNPIHNTFLVLLSEHGVIFTLPLLYFFCYRFYKIKSVLRSEYTVNYKIFHFFSIGLICSICIHGMAEWIPLSTSFRNIWILVFIASALSKYRNEGLEQQQQPYTL